MKLGSLTRSCSFPRNSPFSAQRSLEIAHSKRLLFPPTQRKSLSRVPDSLNKAEFSINAMKNIDRAFSRFNKKRPGIDLHVLILHDP